jgi:peptidoglycan/LPS O-acetylase OafA/YrhL
MVIAVHASQYFSDLSPGVLALANQGARGVQLFFVASAMTLLMSWNARGDGAGAFYIRRFFRIAPMFYISVPIFLILHRCARGGRSFQPASNYRTGHRKESASSS